MNGTSGLDSTRSADTKRVWDVTGILGAQEALRKSETKFRAITSAAQDAILMIDDEGAVTLWNEAAERVLGYSAEEMMGRNLHEVLPPEQFREAHVAAFPEFTRTGRGAAVGQTLELAAIRKDGEEIPVELSLSSVEIDGHWSAIGIIRDISDRKRVEAERDRLFEELEERVLELRRQAADLVVARNAADKAAQAKAAFLANMSHEIRTPIHGVLGTLDLVLDSELPTDQRQLVQQAYDSGDALLGIINDILDFSKIESGHLDLEEISFDPVGLAEAVVRLLAVRAVESGVELICDVRPDMPRAVRGDPGRIRQVLTNILGNAVKFTEAGEVVVSLEALKRDNGTVDLAFSVRDTGIGIPPDKLETIFEDFCQADVSTSRKFGGTGLGLAISSRLLGLMGSEMQVTSEVGRGSEFRFVLELPVEETSPPEPGGGLDSLRGVRALVVDDNPVNQLIAASMLRKRGHEVHVVANGRLAVEAVEKHEFDVVLMDVQMPELDGRAATREIRQIVRLLNLPIVALTAHAGEDEREACRTAGMDGYLSKPFKPHELFAVVEGWGGDGDNNGNRGGSAVRSGPVDHGLLRDGAETVNECLRNTRLDC